jgi:1,4-alpha-glucan branching enzyme
MPATLWADKVYLVGDFNNWDPCASPFQRMHNGIWRITLDLPAWQRYEFRYLIDDHWCTDHHVDGCKESNGEGINSSIETTLPLESLATSTGHSMVHEAAFDKGMVF